MDGIANAFGGKRWTEISCEDVIRNSSCVYFFSPLALRTYLPAVLFAVLDCPEDSEELLAAWLCAFTPNTVMAMYDYDSDFTQGKRYRSLGEFQRAEPDFGSRMELLTMEMRKAVCAWLEVIATRLGPNDSVTSDRVREAIDGYWSLDF